MVVDDSAVVRGLIVRMLEKAGIEVIASVGDGQQALRALERHRPDVIILDIEMPVMDGLTALPQLVAKQPGVRIIMASTLTEKNASISLRALQLGAADYIPKPTAAREISGGQDFQRELIDKVTALSGKRGKTQTAAPGAARVTMVPAKPVAPITTRPETSLPVRVIAIGSSTGGPQALFEVLKHLTGLSQPILITQHMPPTFTRILATNIERQTRLPTVEATDNLRVEPGKAYVAAGDYHMVAEKNTSGVCVRLVQSPPENFCRPAVDPMFRSVASVYGGGVLGVILTGMGHDGREGAKVVTENKGMIVAQDEQSSVVWGMPGAVVTAGLASRVLPLSDIGAYVRRRAGGR
ncbi:MAG: chemotaxis response regulator protein-glutamate methylesterase [Rhodospirillales bacterium]